MSQQAESSEATAKKGGKLPIIIILALVLGAGGFFGMKMRAPKTAKKPEVKLGAIVKLDEFLVNLNDSGTYLRVTVALHMKEGVKEEEFKEKMMPVVQDAVIDILTSKSLAQIRTLDGKRNLRHMIATVVNEKIEAIEANAKGEKKGETEEAKDKEEKKDKKEGAKEEPTKREHPDWDSDEGPVLKVYFTSFATQ